MVAPWIKKKRLRDLVQAEDARKTEALNAAADRQAAIDEAQARHEKKVAAAQADAEAKEEAKKARRRKKSAAKEE